MSRVVTIRAEPLLRESYTPYGTVIDQSRNPIYCDDGQYFVERLTLHRLPTPMRHINRHFDSVQLFIPAVRTPFLVVVAPPWMSAANFDPTRIKAFVADGYQAFTYAIGTWHIGPRAIDGRPFSLINLQGERSNEVHTEDIDLAARHDTVVQFEVDGRVLNPA